MASKVMMSWGRWSTRVPASPSPVVVSIASGLVVPKCVALLTPDTSPTRALTAISVRSWGQRRFWGEHLARACLPPHPRHGNHPDLARPRVDHPQRRLSAGGDHAPHPPRMA